MTTTTKTSFADLPNDERMRLRAIIEQAGGEIAGYYNGYVQIAIPKPSAPFYAAIEPYFEMVTNSLHYFPLGSDKPADHLRHDGRYPGSRGFWLFASLQQR